MGLLHKLLGRNRAKAAEGIRQPDASADDLLLLHLRETQARLAKISAELEDARARIRELGRRYPYTS
jgi:phage shock protein A